MLTLIAADYQLGRRRERDCTLMVSGEMPAARQRITENASCIARLPRMSAGTMPYDAMADPAMIEATMKAAEPAPEPSCFRIRVTL
jgi:hypothetical protein